MADRAIGSTAGTVEQQKAREASKVIRETENQLYKMEYEKSPLFKRKKKKGNKVKTVQTTKLETFKTIVLTALIAGIIAFLAGMYYEAKKTDQIKSEASALIQKIQAVKPAEKPEVKQ